MEKTGETGESGAEEGKEGEHTKKSQHISSPRIPAARLPPTPAPRHRTTQLHPTSLATRTAMSPAVRAWADSLEEWAATDGLDLAVRAIILAEVMACVSILMSA